MQPTRATRPRGFTLLETTIAMAILAMAALGTLSAINTSNLELRRGQLRIYFGTLADVTLQRMKLPNLTSGVQSNGIPFSRGTLVAPPAGGPQSLAIGASPWLPDSSAVVDDNDLSTGAYFRVLPSGEITHAKDVKGTPDCASVPSDVVCREVLTTSGIGDSDCKSGCPVAQGTAYTVWVRVSRHWDGLSVIEREVYSQ
jgi:prepilin-type N-terminal cleavage/methylation domain-containing protein